MADKALGREALLDAHETQKVELEALDGVVYAQPLPFSLGQQLMERATTNGGPPEDADEINVTLILPDLLVHGIVDESGERIFTDEDREAIDNMPFQPAMVMATAVLDVSGLTEDAQQELQGN